MGEGLLQKVGNHLDGNDVHSNELDTLNVTRHRASCAILSVVNMGEGLLQKA